MKLDLVKQIKLGESMGGAIQFAVVGLNGGDHEDCAHICNLLTGYFADKAKIDREQKQATSEDVAMQTQENSSPNPSEQQTKD
ncbi:hypothetical protein ACO4GX_002165 [Yersinia enterocolitica]